ncbi:MAG: outer membrane beta-barrel protein [Prevotella sp.]|nr:outer membrane beta-barrel protein [Prevotella sp.]MDY5369696.1 outer membrane beta-barrel protein [Prevotella sp.]
MFKKFLCAIVLVCCVGTTVNAQEKDSKKNQFVIYAGPQLSTANGGASLSGKFSWLAGVQYERMFGEGGFGMYAGGEYTAKGIKDYKLYNLSDYSSMKDEYNLNYIQLNLGVKYAKEIWGFNGFGEIGPYVAYGLGGSAKCDGYKMDDGSFGDWTSTVEGGVGFKKFDFGINVAIGAEYNGFRLMVGYQQGLTDIAGERLADGYKNYGFYAKVGYAFGF